MYWTYKKIIILCCMYNEEYGKLGKLNYTIKVKQSNLWFV